MTNKVSVVVGGQFGSEGKGAIAAYLSSAEQNRGRHVIAVRVAGPNAGHTVMGRCPVGCAEQNGRAHGGPHESGPPHPWRLRQVPVAAVTNPDAELVIAAGSEVDPTVLSTELRELDSAGYAATNRLTVDRSATVIEPSHLQAEQELNLTARLGSTGKGIGAARMARLSRVASTWLEYRSALVNAAETELSRTLMDVGTADTAFYLNRMLVRDDAGKSTHVIIEGTQGYGLGLHTRFYPTVTSSDCRAIDFLAMAGISPWVLPCPLEPVAGDTALADDEPFEVWVVLRTYPIRVAGNSGPLRGETTWSQLGLEQEHTTVTQKVRRVGEWDPLLAREAVEANGGSRTGRHLPPVRVALTMADHVVSSVAGHTNASYDEGVDPGGRQALFDLLTQVARDCGVFPRLVGTGPTSLLDLRPGDQPLPGLGTGVINRIQHEAGRAYTWEGGQ